MTEQEMEEIENNIMDSIDGELGSIQAKEDKKDLLSMLMDSINDRYQELI